MKTIHMKSVFREYLPFALAILCLFAARSSLADHYVVPTGSMEHTLVPGDRVVVDKRAYGLRVPFTLHKVAAGATPTHGDIVIFDSPADGTRLIKRVVGVGGDIIEVREGRVLVNGAAFGAQPDVINLEFGGGPDLVPVPVPPGQVFVLGDARGNSVDSRYFGFVRADEIYGQAIGVYFRSGEGIVWKRLSLK